MRKSLVNSFNVVNGNFAGWIRLIDQMGDGIEFGFDVGVSFGKDFASAGLVVGVEGCISNDVGVHAVFPLFWLFVSIL